MYQIEDKDTHFKTRLADMRSARGIFERQWTLNQDQTDARSYEDGEKFYPNTKLEQAIIEMRLWGRSGDITIDVEPDQYNPNIQDAEIAKHFLYKFMHEEEWHKELRQRRHDKAIYWTGIFWCGISHRISCEVKRNEVNIKPQIGNWYFDKKSKKKVYKEHWYFMPKNLSVYSFFIDDNAVNQPDPCKAVDCIMLIHGSKEDVKNRRENIPGVDMAVLDALVDVSESDPEYGEGSPKGQVTEYWYFNRLTKDWWVYLNEKDLLYATEYEYECEGLPFVITQHHPRNNKVYGMGEPEVIAALKAAKNANWQAIIEGVMMSSGKLLLSGNSGDFVDSTDNAIRVYSWEVSIKEVTNSVEQYKEVDTSIDLNPAVSLNDLIDKEVMAATGININAPFDVVEEKLWQTEIREENKAIRLKAIDELEDFGIGEAMTIALGNLIKFAPVLKRGRKEISVNGTITEVSEPYKIHIPNVSVKKKKGQIYIEEDLGKYGELEFTDDLIEGKLKVRVITPSTANSQLTVLEKNKVNEMVQIIMSMSQIYGVETVLEKVPFDFAWDKVMHAYGYGDPERRVQSKKQITREKNAAKVDRVQDLLNQMEHVANPQPTTNWPAIGGSWELQTQEPVPGGVL